MGLGGYLEDALHVEGEEGWLCEREEGESDPEETLRPVQEEDVHDPRRKGEGESCGEEREEPGGGVHGRHHALGCEVTEELRKLLLHQTLDLEITEPQPSHRRREEISHPVLLQEDKGIR